MSVMAVAVPFYASASEECSIKKGLPERPAEFAKSASACADAVAGVKFNGASEAELARLTNVARQASGRSRLTQLESLHEAARLHALDLAARNYASHTDLEGRSHLDRVRLIERRYLIGAFGAVVTIVPAGSTEKEIQLALLGDSQNADNLLRREFSHAGIGVAEANGRVYVVQLFASVPGELSSAMPAAIVKDMEFKLADDSGRDFKRWQILSRSGSVLATGRTPRLNAPADTDWGYLTFEFEENGRSISLKGPAVQVK